MNLPPNYADHKRLRELQEEKHWANRRDLRHARACGRTEMFNAAQARVLLLDFEIQMLKRKLGLP